MAIDDGVDKYLGMTEEDLFAELGDSLATEFKYGASVSVAQKQELARNWLNGHINSIRNSVCGSLTLKDLSNSGDTTALFAALIPLVGLSAAVTSSAIVAAIIVRIGLRRLCIDNWSPVVKK